MKEAIKLKSRGKQRASVLFFQDNRPVHTAQARVAEVANSDFELLPHPSYSLDIAASDCLFPKLKSYLVVIILETMMRSCVLREDNTRVSLNQVY